MDSSDDRRVTKSIDALSRAHDELDRSATERLREAARLLSLADEVKERMDRMRDTH